MHGIRKFTSDDVLQKAAMRRWLGDLKPKDVLVTASASVSELGTKAL